ncbi:DUF2889 domain-containing protein [Novosphingobium rosa]|uniref:DUF2889 domain-containing protein n=1 Tax=Novosphingobium rosa TaxID=76978 RepID=UPI000B222B76|nr:DUF2889 domain-containing protein [Novosphingobium rosa]
MTTALAVALNATPPSQPARRPMSLRRTSSLQTHWPEGAANPMVMAGRARDCVTRHDGSNRIVESEWLEARFDKAKRLAGLRAGRRSDGLADFTGLAPGGPMRKAMATAMPEEGARATLLHRMLDDMAGATFMASAAWYAWPGGTEGYHVASQTESFEHRQVEGVCISYFADSYALTPEGTVNDPVADHPRAPPALPDADRLGWHDLAPTAPQNQWRLRRTDLWQDDDGFQCSAWFQDSASLPGTLDQRIIFHEYALNARFAPDTLALLDIAVDARVLPFSTCRAAPATARKLIGIEARDLRLQVPRLLAGAAGCTHLNDMLRSIQDIEGMRDRLCAEMAAG